MNTNKLTVNSHQSWRLFRCIWLSKVFFQKRKRNPVWEAQLSGYLTQGTKEHPLTLLKYVSFPPQMVPPHPRRDKVELPDEGTGGAVGLRIEKGDGTWITLCYSEVWATPLLWRRWQRKVFNMFATSLSYRSDLQITSCYTKSQKPDREINFSKGKRKEISRNKTYHQSARYNFKSQKLEVHVK